MLGQSPRMRGLGVLRPESSHVASQPGADPSPLAEAISPRLVPGRNRLRDVFLDEAEAAMFPDWERATAALVASFRTAVGTETDDPRVVELVGRLSLTSTRFRQLWARHDSCNRRRIASITFEHPQVGPLTLDREKLLLNDTDGIMLVIYHPEPGTESADKLALLASAALTAEQAPTRSTTPRRP